jgi:hypothetical protein
MHLPAAFRAVRVRRLLAVSAVAAFVIVAPVGAGDGTTDGRPGPAQAPDQDGAVQPGADAGVPSATQATTGAAAEPAAADTAAADTAAADTAAADTGAADGDNGDNPDDDAAADD